MISTVFVVGLLVFWLATVFLIRNIEQGRWLWFWLVWPLFPVTDIREQWWRLFPWVLLRALGLAALLFSSTLYLVQLPAVQDYFLAGQQANKDDNLDGSLLATEMAMWRDVRRRKNEHLAGVLQGEAFVPTRTELIGSILSIHTGNEFLPDKEVRLVFDKPLDTRSPLEMVVNAADIDGPKVHVSWRDPMDGSFQTKIITGGYRLNLAWYPLDKNQLAAQIELVLPSEQMTYLAGDTFIHTNKLRFKFGQVDPAYDHEDTLVYLLEQRIADRYPSRLIRKIQLLDAHMKVLQGTGVVRMLVTLENERVEEWRLDFRRTDEGWQPAAGGLEVTKMVDATETNELEIQVLSAKEALANRSVEFNELASFVGQEVTVNARDSNNLREGVLQEATERGLLLLQKIGAGGVEVFFPAYSVISIQLASGETFYVARPDEEKLVDEDARALSGDIEVQKEVGEAEPTNTPNPYQTLLNKWVEVVDTKGRTRAGELTNVGYYVTIRVPMGAGSTEYHYQLNDIESITQVPRP